MRETFLRVTCERCKRKYEVKEVGTEVQESTPELSELAKEVADALGWKDLCAKCAEVLNKIVTGDSRHCLVPGKKRGVKGGNKKEAKSGREPGTGKFKKVDK